MAWEDDDWPNAPDDPEMLERRREVMSQMAAARNRALRWVYAGLAILIVVVIVLAVTR